MRSWNKCQYIYALACCLAAVVMVLTCCAAETAAPPREQEKVWRLVTFNERVLYMNYYQRLTYKAMADCLGRDAAGVDRIEWRRADAIWNITDEHWAAGLYLDRIVELGYNIIILIDPNDPTVVSHESLHDLTGLDDGHPEFENARERCEVGYRGPEFDGVLRPGEIQKRGGANGGSHRNYVR